MSYKKWIEYASLINDTRLKDWATRRFASTSESIDLEASENQPIKFDLFKAMMLRNIHGKHVFRECSIFGNNDEFNFELCNKIFQETTYSVKPRLQDIYKCLNKNNQLKRISLVVPYHIYCSPDYLINDLFFHYIKTSKDAGHTTHSFDASNLMYSNFTKTMALKDSLQMLEQHLINFNPEIIITDGNFLPDINTITPSIWNELKSKFHFKLVTTIPDAYDAQPDFYGVWSSCSDIIILLNRLTSNYRAEKKSMLCPCLPFDASIFKADNKKDIDLLYIGSNSRNRIIWINALSLSGINIYAVLHDRQKDVAPDHEEYGRLLSRSKLIINNGWVNEADTILTGRFFEGIMAKSVILQEVGTNAEEFFTPFRHYVPISNFKQALVFTRYLLANDHIREKIAEEAISFYDHNYSAEHFWNCLCEKLFSDFD